MTRPHDYMDTVIEILERKHGRIIERTRKHLVALVDGKINEVKEPFFIMRIGHRGEQTIGPDAILYVECSKGGFVRSRDGCWGRLLPKKKEG